MMRMRNSLLMCAFPLAIALPSPPAHGALPDTVTMIAGEPSELTPISDESLAEQRGGIRVMGLEISLGAQIRTYLDGELVLLTNVHWTPQGANSSTSVFGALTPVDSAQLQAGILSDGGITMTVGNETVHLANGGRTAFVHRSENGIQNILLNTANKINARQELDITLGLGDYDAFGADVVATGLAGTLSSMISSATLRNIAR